MGATTDGTGWLDEVLVLRSARRTSTTQQVRAAETALGWAFPPGYESYVTTLGEGDYCGWVRIVMPDALTDPTAWPGVAACRRTWSTAWFWDRATLTPDDIPSLAPLGSTHDGDEIVTHRDGGIFVLPRHEDEVRRCGTTLQEALDHLTEDDTPSFCPWGEPTTYDTFDTPVRGDDASYERAREAVTALGLHAATNVTGTGTQLLVPAIGGSVTLARSGTAQVMRLTSRAAESDAFTHALVSAGMVRRPT